MLSNNTLHFSPKSKESKNNVISLFSFLFTCTCLDYCGLLKCYLLHSDGRIIKNRLRLQSS